MLEWKNKQDGIDDVLAEDINSIANNLIKAQRELEEIVVDQTYNPESPNAQSGKAVNQAFEMHQADDKSHRDLREEIIRLKGLLSAGMTRQRLSFLPTFEDAEENVIYMIPNHNDKGLDCYDEYILAPNHVSTYKDVFVSDASWDEDMTPFIVRQALCVYFHYDRDTDTIFYAFSGYNTKNEKIEITFTQPWGTNFSANDDFANMRVDFEIFSQTSLTARVSSFSPEHYFERIGSTAVDLSGYATEESVDNKISSAIGEALEGDY